jgi:hypothetical protein
MMLHLASDSPVARSLKTAAERTCVAQLQRNVLLRAFATPGIAVCRMSVNGSGSLSPPQRPKLEANRSEPNAC